MNVDINYLEEIYDNKKLSKKYNEIVNILLESLDNWPTEVSNLGDFEFKIYDLIGVEINKKNLEKYLKNINLSKFAWNAESLHILLDIFDFYNIELSLYEIFEDLNIEIKKIQTE